MAAYLKECLILTSAEPLASANITCSIVGIEQSVKCFGVDVL